MDAVRRNVTKVAVVLALAAAIRVVTVVNPRFAAIVIGASAGVAFAAGMLLQGRERTRKWRTAWALLGAGLMATASATILATLPAASSAAGSPAAEALRAAGAMLTVAGLLGLMRKRIPGKALEAAGEAVIIALSVGFALFAVTVAPTAHGGWGGAAELGTVVVACMDVAALWVCGRFLSLSERAPVAYRYVAAALGCLLVADAIDLGFMMTRHGHAGWGTTSVELWTLCLMAAAALHPSNRSPFEPVPARAVRLSPAHLVAMGSTLAVVPAVFAANAARGLPASLPVVLVGSAILPMAVVAHLTGQVVSRAAAEYRAQHDPLTGLCNRVLFNDRLEMAIVHAGRVDDSVGVMFLDLDRFKSINDSLGHGVGNDLLRAVANRLQGCLRDEDSVARLGGDEFTILLPNVADRAECCQVAERVLAAFREPFTIGRRQLTVQTSIGIAMFPADGDTADDLLKHADTAMYRAKARGRGTYEVYDTGMSARARLRFALEESLRQAMRRRQLDVYYQPKIDAVTGRITGVEALARWHHPRLGFISPWAFIGLAEETGLIVTLGEWVLETSCRQARQWLDQGMPPVPVAVNLSSQQFAQSPIVDVVANVLERTGLDPQLLELEVTESAVVQDMGAVSTTLSRLRSMGVRCSIDDFGTGYSALNYLADMPVDALKIDRSFVQGMDAHATQAAIVRAVIALAHSLDLVVIAEGVETEEQLRLLRDQGCEQLQGHLFSPALPAAEATRLLRQGGRRPRRSPAAGLETAAVDQPAVAPERLNELLEGIVGDGRRADLDLASVDLVLTILAQDRPDLSGARTYQTLAARLAAGTFAGLVPLSGGLAAAGALPAPMQRAATQALAALADPPPVAPGSAGPSDARTGVIGDAARHVIRQRAATPPAADPSQPGPDPHDAAQTPGRPADPGGGAVGNGAAGGNGTANPPPAHGGGGLLPGHGNGQGAGGLDVAGTHVGHGGLVPTPTLPPITPPVSVPGQRKPRP